MSGIGRTVIATVLTAIAHLAGCAAEGGPADEPGVHGVWRWVGSFGGIVGIRPTPTDEGYERIFHFRRNGSLTIYAGDSTRARIDYRVAPVHPEQDVPPRPGVRYADPLTAFPFDPGVDRHVLRRAGPDTLILADPCCHRYEHAFVRVE